MATRTVTEKEGHSPVTPSEHEAGPGLLLVFSVHEPMFAVLRLRDGAIELGRDEILACGVRDARVSRQHLGIEQDGRRFLLRDRGSTNGSFLDGRQLDKKPVEVMLSAEPARTEDPQPAPQAAVVRIGRTVLLLLADVAPYERAGLSVQEDGEVVMGPLLQRQHERIRLLAGAGESVLLTGPSGVGKEVAARAYHQATGRPHGPFVAVNCATIPRELAEVILFGARRGAYSGATADSDGLIQAAHGGTLFLDEIGELELAIQAKLLRVLESREVLALGTTRPRAVDLRLCAATLVDLEQAVQKRTFREDLFFRIGRPMIKIPPLRQRPEELATLIHHTLRSLPGKTLPASAALIEACLLRSWPGNVRELRTELRTAGLTALAAGSTEVEASHLAPAGRGLIAASTPPELTSASDSEPSSAQLIHALRGARGNLTAAAQELAIPRTSLRRLVERHGIDLSTFRNPSRS